MLVSVLGFGSIWTRRLRHTDCIAQPFSPRNVAYYNTTGVPVGGRIRNRPRIYGIARYNAVSGFRPDQQDRMLGRVFECNPPCVWQGHPKIFLNALRAKPERPDAYLVVLRSAEFGAIAAADPWLSADGQVISFSQDGPTQEAMVVLPAFSWVRCGKGTLFLEPLAGHPWRASWVPLVGV